MRRAKHGRVDAPCVGEQRLHAPEHRRSRGQRGEGLFRDAVASFGVATVRADAGYGAILPGDLLTASPTPGHAMRAFETLPGTLVGKALDGLDAGTGTIRIVVLLR